MEIRVTIEVLDDSGNVVESRECLSEFSDGETDPGFLGSVETELDELAESWGVE